MYDSLCTLKQCRLPINAKNNSIKCREISEWLQNRRSVKIHAEYQWVIFINMNQIFPLMSSCRYYTHAWKCACLCGCGHVKKVTEHKYNKNK